jgi:hypothetical protein
MTTRSDEDFDENGLLRDGRSARVGMMMRDSLSPVQRAIMRDCVATGRDKIYERAAADERVTIVDAFGNGGAALQRPGVCYGCTPAQARQPQPQPPRPRTRRMRTRGTRPTSSTTPRRRGGGGRAPTARSRSSASPGTRAWTLTWIATSTTPTRGASKTETR